MMLKNGVFITSVRGGWLSGEGRVTGHVSGQDLEDQNITVGILEMNKMLFCFH
jgi:hypothetical protein